MLRGLPRDRQPGGRLTSRGNTRLERRELSRPLGDEWRELGQLVPRGLAG